MHSRSSYAFLIFLLHLGARRAWEWLCFFNWLIKPEASPSCPELSQLWLESIICRIHFFFKIKKSGRWQCTHKNIIKLTCWSGSSYTWPWHVPSEHTGDPAPQTPSVALRWWKWQQQSGQYKHPDNPAMRDRVTKKEKHAATKTFLYLWSRTALPRIIDIMTPSPSFWFVFFPWKRPWFWYPSWNTQSNLMNTNETGQQLLQIHLGQGIHGIYPKKSRDQKT